MSCCEVLLHDVRRSDLVSSSWIGLEVELVDSKITMDDISKACPYPEQKRKRTQDLKHMCTTSHLGTP
jgi:hypothetical protein